MQRTLVLSMPPYAHATRTRKAALAYMALGPVMFLAPQGVGRTGKRDDAGTEVRDGIIVHHATVGKVNNRPTRWSQIRNLVACYVPALGRVTRHALRTRAEVVHVTGLPLLPVALLHRSRYSSTLVLDVNERPASVGAEGSLFAVLARVEPLLLRWAQPRADIVTVVTAGHADILSQDHGFRDVTVVRNAPRRDWRAVWTPPPAHEPAVDLHVVTVGTLFEGRGFESMIDAVAIARRAGVNIQLDIYGGGRPDYLEALRDRAKSLALQDLVEFCGRVPASEVSATYLKGDIGLALYEPGDAGNDSLSNKLLEVVATGRPVLAGDLPENRRFVTHHDVGWLTATDPYSLAVALQECIKPGELERVTLNCRALAEAALTWEQEFQPVADQLSRLTTSSRSKTRVGTEQ